MNIDVNSQNSVTQSYSLYPAPNKLCLPLTYYTDDDNNITIVASNCTTTVEHHANAMQIALTHAVADTGATSIFVIAGAPANNIHVATKPIHISLPDGKKIVSTHICDVDIPGQPHKLIGQIVPEIKMTSLLGIRILCKAGCEVIFYDEKCQVNFKGKMILTRYKDLASNLWTLPILHGGGQLWITPGSNGVASKPTPSLPGPCKGRAPQPPFVSMPKLASFSCHQTTTANAVKFMHQSLCNPPITSLIKAINASFLCGAQHLNAKSIQKYLMPSPAMSKGHMKGPHKGLQSMTPKPTHPSLPRLPCAPSIHHPIMPGLIPNNYNEDKDNEPQLAFIEDINNESIANVFCFGAFADKKHRCHLQRLHRQLPLHVAQWQHMFFCDVPLQNKYHLCHAHPWNRFTKYPRCIQKELQISCKQRVYSKNQCHGESGNKGHQIIPYSPAMLPPACRTRQSPCQCSQTSYPNIQKLIHRRPRHHRSGLSHPTLGQACPTSARLN